MANITEKTSANIFYRARISAAQCNDQMSSREGAADVMCIQRGRLYRIEKGVANPYPEEVHLMADLYHAPELVNYYCTSICPLGKDMPRTEISSLDRITVKAMAAMQHMDKTKELLLSVTEDGVVDETEMGEMQRVLESLEEIEQVTQNLKLWMKKNMKG